MTNSANALDEIANAHKLIGGSGRGRRYATQQVNQAYVVLLSSQFQKFCRGLHTECAQLLTEDVANLPIKGILKSRLTVGKKLDRGNPNPGNIGHDFQWFGIDFWDEIHKVDARNKSRQQQLEELNLWRNAIAHQDFAQCNGKCTVTLQEVKTWRSICNSLAHEFDKVMYMRLDKILDKPPW